MKPTVIFSVRGCHMDDLPAVFVQRCLKFLHNTYPNLPVTLCFEGDPISTLDEIKMGFKEKTSSSRSRYVGQTYTVQEAEYDKSIYWLLSTVTFYKIPFVLTDLQDISKIPLGSPEAEAMQAARESCMANAILKVATETGGIIFDFGGSNHIPGIQSHLKQVPEILVGTNVQAHFFCVYSIDAQIYFPAEFRLMQFTSVPQDKYPLGLTFKTTALEETPSTEVSILDRIDAVQMSRDKLFFTFQGEILTPAVEALFQKASLVSSESLVGSQGAPFLPLASATSSSSSSSSTTFAPPSLPDPHSSLGNGLG